MPRSFVVLLILLMPLFEIAGFVVVGSRVGALATVGLVLLSTVAGAMLLRFQGLGALRRIQDEIAAGGAPEGQIVHGAMILLAGILLIIPGFISDIFGLLLFIPVVREAVWSAIRSRVTVVAASTGGPAGATRRAGGQRVIDLDERDYREINGDTPPRRGDSRD